jgi:hypothetical protein
VVKNCHTGSPEKCKFKLYCDRRPVAQDGVLGQICITVGHLRSSCFGAPSLMSGRVCNVLVHFAVTHPWPHLTVSFEPPPTWMARSPYLYPPGTGWSIYTPRHWVPILPPLTTHRSTVEVSNRPPHRFTHLN